MVAASELPIGTVREGTTATDMANAIFGNGLTATGAAYFGDIDSAGLYSGGDTSAPSVTQGDTGVIMSNGYAKDFTNSSGQSNQNTNTSANTTGTNGFDPCNSAAGASTFDASTLDIDFTITLTLKLNVNVGVTNAMRIAIADGSDSQYDPNLLIAAAAGECVAELFQPGDLVNDRSLRRRVGSEVTYVHLLFDRHQVVFSEGLETESFLPGPQTTNSFERESIDEICVIYPEIDPETGDGYSPTARRTLKRYEADLLRAAKVA